jgi:hypothetical protein
VGMCDNGSGDKDQCDEGAGGAGGGAGGNV